MIVFKAPEQFKNIESKKKIFLGGSIESGSAENWQKRFIDKLSLTNPNCIVFNPRREEWDASWTMTKDDINFRTQVYWEVKHIELSDIVVMNFIPNTLAPISLLELGLVSKNRKRQKVIVYCPEGFYRKGNVDIICEIYGCTQVNSEIELFNTVLLALN